MYAILKASIRQNAIYIADASLVGEPGRMTETTSVLTANAAKLGFTFSETLLQALNRTTPTTQLEILSALKDVTGVNKNWTPLVKGWDTPTGETITDHIMTFFANVFKARGTTLPCGHIIPANTFPLERYNGCPFCGTPFVFGEIEDYGQGSKLKVLDLWTTRDAEQFLEELLTSKTALDATQADSLKMMLDEFEVPAVKIEMKETLMLVIDALMENGKGEKASVYFANPAEILRYLWYRHTGFLQVIEPRTIIKRTAKNNLHLRTALSDTTGKAALAKKLELKLKYSRKECLVVATWLNNLDLPAEKCCEIMHPKRGMWVRFIRALRLAEYSKREGFEKLRELLDYFYNSVYDVWMGRVNHFRLKVDAEKTFELLKQRPGLFARSLFSNMLWFGADQTIAAFSQVVDQIPARLVFTLNMYAQEYFRNDGVRSVKPLGGVNKMIANNQLLKMYSDKQLDQMKAQIEDLCTEAMMLRFMKQENANQTIYIDPQLFNIPVSIGDRSETVQDLPAALMGTRFPLEGNEVRLFMQWGQGMRAQHLDMDLSCYVAYESRVEICSFSRLHTTGCKHSGDIRSIPDQIGTAEYIQINVDELRKAEAKYVVFTCNAYSNGSITPNLVVGWMDSKYPMRISEKTGVAYDPSCVQHQVRVTQSVAKGLIFGVLDVEKAEIVWLEMSFSGQLVQGINFKGVKAMLSKLNSKLNVGNLLTLKAEAQGLNVVETTDADEVYDMAWARNTAAVTQLLID